jgi:hypothetical protein
VCENGLRVAGLASCCLFIHRLLPLHCRHRHALLLPQWHLYWWSLLLRGLLLHACRLPWWQWHSLLWCERQLL